MHRSGYVFDSYRCIHYSFCRSASLCRRLLVVISACFWAEVVALEKTYSTRIDWAWFPLLEVENSQLLSQGGYVSHWCMVKKLSALFLVMKIIAVLFQGCLHVLIWQNQIFSDAFGVRLKLLSDIVGNRCETRGRKMSNKNSIEADTNKLAFVVVFLSVAVFIIYGFGSMFWVVSFFCEKRKASKTYLSGANLNRRFMSDL